MKIKNKSLIFITLAILVLILGNIVTFAENEINIILNDKVINFPDAKPYIDTQSNRILVPARFIAENLDAFVRWNPNNREINIIKGGLNIKFKPGEKQFILNNVKKPIDTAAFIQNDRVFVPLRAISESLNLYVKWDEKTYTVSLSDEKYKDEDFTKDKEFVIQGIFLGQSEEELISKLGEPNRKDLSEYGFHWYIYNGDYKKYIQVGVKDNKVVAIYTNADNWKSAKGIKIGITRANVEKLLGKSLKYISKGGYEYIVSSGNERGVYLIDDSYVSIYYDIHNKNTVTALQIIDKDIEHSLEGFYGEYSTELRDSFERQIFDLANAIRVRKNLKPFGWNEKAHISARKHSEDMAYNDFFAHNNLKRETPFDRMKEEDINYISAAENIAAGTASAIQSHEGWMNSRGHRVNILGDFSALGVGVSYDPDSKYKYYYTQNFFKSVYNPNINM